MIRAVFLISAGLVLLIGLPPMPTLPVWTRPDPVVTVPAVPGPATHAVYVYEKDLKSVPNGVTVGLDRLNRAGIVANLVEADTTNGSGSVPDQFKPAIPPAMAAGLPALVVLSGTHVVRVVQAPSTVEAVTEAAK